MVRYQFRSWQWIMSLRTWLINNEVSILLSLRRFRCLLVFVCAFGRRARFLCFLFLGGKKQTQTIFISVGIRSNNRYDFELYICKYVMGVRNIYLYMIAFDSHMHYVFAYGNRCLRNLARMPAEFIINC